MSRRSTIVRRLQFAADCVAIAVTVLVLEMLQNVEGDLSADFVAFGAVLLPCWLLLSSVHRLHFFDEERADHSTPGDLTAVFQALLAAVFLAAAIENIFGVSGAPTFTAAAVALVVSYPLLVSGRALARTIARRRPGYRQRALVIGAGEVGQLIARKLGSRGEYAIDCVGFIDPAPGPHRPIAPYGTIVGELDDAAQIVVAHSIDRVFVAFSLENDRKVADVTGRLEDLGVQVDIVPRLYDLVGPHALFHTVEGMPMIGLPARRPSRVVMAVKRTIDIVLAGSGLLLAAPLVAAIAVAVRLESSGPSFYRSERIGAGGQRLRLLKFRTMHSEACRGDEYGGEAAEATFAELMSDPELAREFKDSHKLKDDPRVTRLGAWLRATSLDELPQLFNVLTGDLSLVGPRAITIDEWNEVFSEGWTYERGPKPYWRIEGLRPGLTGWWQIHGRSDTTYRERIRLDGAYASSMSLRLDMLIVARTIRVLFRRDGAY